MKGPVVALLVAASLCCALALPSCSPNVVDMSTESKLVFATIGDWGRAAATESFFNPLTIQLCRENRQCCSTAQNENFPYDFDLTDQDDAVQQEAAADLMNTVCGEKKCQGVFSLGDTFYPCGADPAASGLNRFTSDWQQVYNSKANLKGLPWYVLVGNHDYGFDGSVARQLAYAQLDANWVFPNRYYATTFKAKDFTFQTHTLDATPFIQNYAYNTAGGVYTSEPNYAYYHEDYMNLANPTYINSDAAAYYNATLGLCTVPPLNASILTNVSANATGQVPWLKSCLSTSTADWNVILAHFALWGSDQEYGNPTNNVKYYPGMCGAWGTIQNLVNQYGVDAWINGHDHTMTHADPMHMGSVSGTALGYGNTSYTVTTKGATQYFTFGNGGSVAYGDGVAPIDGPKSYNNYSAVIYNNNYNGSPGEGFGIITITKCNMTVEMYSYIDYAEEKKPVHTVFIPGKC